MDDKWKDFLVNGGIYDTIQISCEDINDITDLLTGEYSIDLYCPVCKENSVYKKLPRDQNMKIRILALNRQNSNPPPPYYGEPPISQPVTKRHSIPEQKNKSEKEEAFSQLCEYGNEAPINFICSREDNTKLSIFLKFTTSKVIKIGQYPSPIDISSNIPSKYSKLLGPYFSEYKKSIVLHSEGYHVGAYSYLRRIIEYLLESAHQEAEKSPDWNDEGYTYKHFEDKIKLLEDYLPNFFVQNVPLYGLVSKGIHELSEDDCESMYPILKSAIDYTLDEIIEKKEQQRKKEETEKTISALASKYGKK
ncbi:hypothetical protein [Caproiciproducens sp.]|uniref:hypothetical protein n=1 Tax=Caproiciproducens sp. TaxID=1954376 RepID=UPI00289AE10E|nr:hypothetical protein [Caproiciproducens sp.]